MLISVVLVGCLHDNLINLSFVESREDYNGSQWNILKIHFSV